jgi:hypothetical protein
MRMFSLRISPDAGLRPSPGQGYTACQGVRPRRRLDDHVADIFRRALVSNKLENAAELLMVMENGT